MHRRFPWPTRPRARPRNVARRVAARSLRGWALVGFCGIPASLALLTAPAVAQPGDSSPNTSAPKSVGLKEIERRFGEVVFELEAAALEQDAGRRETAVKASLDRFETEVETPLRQRIARLEKRLEATAAARRAAEGAAAEEKPSEEEASAEEDSAYERDLSELNRVHYFLVLGRKIPDGQADLRQTRLEGGLELARKFVDDRFTFPLMQYRGQLEIGLLLYELQRFSEAAEEFAPVVTPPRFGNPSAALVGAFREMRLEALLFAARALSADGRPELAVEMIRREYLESDPKHPFDISMAESDEQLSKFGVQVRLELGVAQAAAGQLVEGLDEIQKVIDRYDPAVNPNAKPAEEAFATDARRALGRLAATGAVRLQGKAYYQAALGLKSIPDLPGALRLFQRALAELPASDVAQLAPLCLNEIGEISYLLGRFKESALAYGELNEYFRGSISEELGQKAAQNFLAASTKAMAASGASEHTALAALQARAKELSGDTGGGLGVIEAFMAEASRLQEAERYLEAREQYLQVPQQHHGTEIPFYWRARASAWACVQRAHDEVKGEDSAGAKEKATLAAELEEGIVALAEIVPAALAAGDTAGAATGALTLGLIHYDRQEWSEAATALAVFDGELADEEGYRCAGLGYLVLSHVEQGDCTAAARIVPRFKACTQDPILNQVALPLAECFRGVGDAARAARFSLIFWKTARKRDREDLPTLLLVAERLLDGGKRYVKSAGEVLKTAKKVGGRDPELKRKLLYFQAKVAAEKGAWSQAIEVYDRYIKNYGAKGASIEDAYVHRGLAEAYRRRSKKLSVSDAEKAELSYARACGLLNSWRRQSPTLEPEFWRWAYRWLEIKKFLGDRGQDGAFGEIHLFVDENKHSEMGGLRDKFLKLQVYANKKKRPRGNYGN